MLHCCVFLYFNCNFYVGIMKLINKKIERNAKVRVPTFMWVKIDVFLTTPTSTPSNIFKPTLRLHFLGCLNTRHNYNSHLSSNLDDSRTYVATLM